jgi:hypothetical protein
MDKKKLKEEFGSYRIRVVKIISKMLDDPYSGGIYRTSDCYEALDALIASALHSERERTLEEVKSMNIFANKYKAKEFQRGISAVYDAINNLDSPPQKPVALSQLKKK